MTQESRVIILTASYGEGHNRVSKSLKAALERRGTYSAAVVDLFQLASPSLDKLIRFIYKYSSVISVWGLNYYGWSYYWTRRLPHDHRLARWINSWGKATLKQLIDREKPDLLIYTFPFGAVDSSIKAAGQLRTAAVLTDYSIHNRWLYSQADHYYVPSEEVKDGLIEQGLDTGRITVSGIPVQEVYEQHDAGNGGNGRGAKYVLLMGEMCGTTRQLNALLHKLLSIPEICILVVCGWRKQREQKLQQIWGNHSRIKIEGYANELHLLMKQAVCMITKSGAITLTEAAHVGVPLILFKPYPGQEKENAEYFAAIGAALLSYSADELIACVKKLVQSEAEREALKQKQRLLTRFQASDTIISHLLDGMGKEPGCEDQAAPSSLQQAAEPSIEY